MRDALLTAGLAAAIFVALVIQQFLPAVGFMAGARLSLVPIFFCYGALIVPYPLMIVLALLTGFLADLAALQVVSGAVEIPLGWSILVYVAAGSICQGLRPLVLRGHWELHALMSGLTTTAILALQFGMISMRRFEVGGLVWNETVAWWIFGPGLMALLVAPVIYFAIGLMSGRGFIAGRQVVEF